VHIISVLITGLIAGWLAGKVMRGSGYGIVMDLALGLVGAVVGNWLFRQLEIQVVGSLDFLVMATIGAVILVGAVHLLGGTA
jgi:uncharacterized membrane protein YeaQ/YmgE (transglycosylase-associated protein family)